MEDEYFGGESKREPLAKILLKLKQYYLYCKNYDSEFMQFEGAVGTLTFGK